MTHPADENTSDHAKAVKAFVRDYRRAEERCHSEFSRSNEDRANAAIDDMRKLEKRVIILPEGRA